MNSLNTIRRINAEAKRQAANTKTEKVERVAKEYVAKSGKRVTIYESVKK